MLDGRPDGNTLAGLKARGDHLWASCSTLQPPCSHFGDLDTDALIARFGPDFNFADRQGQLRRRLRCSRCGRKGHAELRRQTPQTNTGGGAWSWQAGMTKG